MRRLALLLSAALLLAAAAPLRAAESLAVVLAGKSLAPVPSALAGGQVYLDVQRVGAIYGGQVYWSQVSGRLRLTLRGRAMRFTADSDSAESGGETFALGAPVLVRGGRAYVPLAFLRSDAFARWSGFDARFDDGTRTLSVERRPTVGPVRLLPFQDRTRVVLELAPGTAYKTEARGVGGVEVSIPFGVAAITVGVPLGDKNVASYSLEQQGRSARLDVLFAGGRRAWRAVELDGPRRLAIDVFADGVAATDAPPADEPPPAAAAPTAPASAPAAAPASAPAPAETLAAPETAAVAAPVKPAPVKRRRRVIVIDAGHGGMDPGATGRRGTREKDIALAAALELARVLRARGEFDVVLTRKKDVFVPLSGRSKAANDIDADLFVSLHCNSSEDRKERGFEVYSVAEEASDPEAEKLAAAENKALELEDKKEDDQTAREILLAMTKTEMVNESAPFGALVEREMAKRLDVPDRGLKQAGFYVLRGTHAPAILVEMAFLSHKTEELELGSPRFRRKVVAGVAAGIEDYARKKGWLK
jgi:N-acetylmuramoyl-L-alanine amidase